MAALFSMCEAALAQTEYTVDVATPGSLETLLSQAHPDYLSSIATLHVTGKLNGSDLATLRKMAGSEDDEENYVYVGALRELDLTGARMVKGGSPYYSDYSFSLGKTVDYEAKDDSLGRYTFYMCHRLQRVMLPKKLNDVGEEVFSFCNNLKEVTFPDGIDTLREALFSNCTSLRLMVIPATVKYIDKWAFSFCSYLKTIICLGNQPAAVRYDNDTYNAFDHMNATYTRVHVPDGAAAAYRNVAGWNQFKIMEYAPDVQLGQRLDSVTIALDRAGELDSTFFRHYPDQERTVKYLKVTGPVNGDDVLMMCNMAAYGSTQELDLGQARIMKGGKPYHSDYNGSYYTATDSVTDRMFLTCQEMLKLTLPASVKYIKATTAFNSNLKELCIDASNEHYEVNAGALYDKQARSLVFCPKGIADKNVVVADGTVLVGDSAFYDFDKLESVELPTTLRTIGKSAFYYNSSLKSVSIPEGVVAIDDNAFSYAGIEQLDLPSTLETLGKNTFNCSHLKDIRVKAATPPAADGGSWDGTFGYVDKDACTVHVPQGKAELYKQAEAWKDFANIVDDLVETGVGEMSASQPVPVAQYGIDGRMAAPGDKGLRIVRYSDGSVKKVWAK